MRLEETVLPAMGVAETRVVAARARGRRFRSCIVGIYVGFRGVEDDKFACWADGRML